MSNGFLDLFSEPLVRVLENHQVKALEIFIGFQEAEGKKHLRIIIQNDAGNKVFDMNCCRQNKDKIKADIDTVRTEIWCQMPKGGKISFLFGKDNHGNVLERDKSFETTLMKSIRRDIHQHRITEGQRSVSYQIKVIAK